MSNIKDLLRQTDWSSHPLGPYENWPTTLKSALRIMSESQFPKMVFWRKEFYCFYNDAFRPSLGSTGKHPSTFGMAYDEAYPEAKHRMRPLMESIFNGGESTSFVDQLIPIYRNGQISEAYWTFSHSPLREEDGTIVGVFLDCFETTSSRKNQEATKDFRSLSDSISQPVFATNTKGGITYSNSNFLAYTGKTFGELQDFGWNSIIPAEDLDKVMKGWMEAIKTDQPYTTEIRYIRHDGQARWFLASVVPVFDSAGKAERWVGSAVDIQNLKDQETEKDIFIGMASHELKTPVTSIKGYVQLLQRAYGNGKDEFLISSLNTLDKQVKSLTKLIGDMLDISKIKTGNVALDLEVFSVDELVKDVIGELSHVNPDHQFIYNKVACDNIFGDRERIGQVLVNFLTNAIKYAPDSHKISIECETKDDRIRVSVIDQGVGLSPADRERVFERFFRSEGKRQDTFPGFGIGLYVAADIIHRHNGIIDVESSLGKGSNFYFELPISKEEVRR